MTFWQAGTLALLCIQAAQAQGPIRLKTREIHVRAKDRANAVRPLSPGARHFLVQFGSYPGPDVRRELERRGMRVISYVPEFALMVSARREVSLEGLDADWAGILEPEDKLSPALDNSAAGAYLVLFHADAEMTEARAWVRQAGMEVLENDRLPARRLLVTGSRAGLETLAREDAVAYIIAASPDLAARRRVMWCDGPIAEAGPIADYALAGTGWPKDAGGGLALLYAFLSLTAKIEGNTARSEIARAFEEWSRYANVTFAERQGGGAARTIDISFFRASHGDGYAFDGPGGVLAHTFYPAPRNAEPVAGDMHFDADENWRVAGGVDLFSVALHEAGHALGLAHSDRPGTVMYPYYSLAAGLTADDIAGARALYGTASSNPAQPGTPSQPTAPPTTPPAPPTAPPTPPENPGGRGDGTPPSVRILSPSLTIVSTTAGDLAVSGMATDNVGVVSVTWSTSNGDSGVASGTARWSAKVPLYAGTNTVLIRAFDAAGNSGWRSLTVIRR